MASSLTYSKMPGFATTAGQDFEMHLCALVFLRALDSGLDFQLGSNVKGAGALDDLVFRCKTPQAPSHWQTMYVQLKHKENASVNRDKLTNPKGDFSLPSYFKSYLDIKETMSKQTVPLLDGSFEDSQFVIFTNARGNHDLGEGFSGNLSRVEEFVKFGSGSFLSFEKDAKMLECLGECGEEGGKFLSRLRVFCSQPNANELKEAVKEELQKLDAETIRGLNIERLCDSFLANVKNWCESRCSSAILDKDHDILLRAVDKVRLESCSEQTLQANKLELEFEQAGPPLPGAGPSLQGTGPPLPGAGPPLPGAGPPLPGAGLSVVQCSAGSCRLRLTKQVQASPGRCLVLTCQQLLDNERALLAEWRKGDVMHLIVCTQDWRSELADPCFEVIRQMLAIGDTRSVRDIVFLQDGNCSVGSELTQEFQGRVQSSSDEFEISQLTDESRDKLFVKAVNLQGSDTTLLEMFNNDSASASQVLDASLVVAVMERIGPLKVGSVLPEGIGYFVERTLEWAFVLKASVFNDLRGTVTIRVTQREASARALMEEAMDFVCSLKDSSSFSQGNKEDVGNKLYQSVFVPDEDDGAVYVGPKFPLGFYECNCVGLRFGRDNAVTALRVCPSEDASEKVSFLFLSNETNEVDARKLSEFHESKHLLLLQHGQLRWIQSLGDIEFVRPHFDECQVLELEPKTAMDVADRLVLVCAEPGMGKSTLMARLAKNTKTVLPHYFVISLALNDHTKLFARGKHKDVLGFLSSASKMDSPLQRSLLKHALEVTGNVVVIADGFDEIAPKYVEECCQLLSSLLGETKASKIWMTSRNSIKQTLEARFSKFSARLRKFDENAQRDFLKKFWRENSDLTLSVDELDTFIDELLAKTSQAVRDKERDFMGIPLQTLMLAEVFEDHVTGSAEKSELPVILDLLGLLEKFVDKKCEFYVQYKLKIPPDHTSYDDHCTIMKENFMANHSTAALSLILGDDDLKTLGMENVIRESAAFCKTISSGKDKTGFIVDIVNGKPRFLHRVFAEYFVAKWISERLAANVELIRSKLFTTDFGVVRSIVDRILSLNFPLHTAVLNEDPEQVQTLLESQVKFIEVKDGGGRTALHLAAGLGTSEHREANVRRGEILDLLIGKTSDFHLADDVLGGSPLRYADITQSWVAIDKLLRKSDNNEQLLLTSANVTHEGMLGTIFDLDLDRLLGFCLDHGLAVKHQLNKRGWGDDDTAIHLAAQGGSVECVELLVQAGAQLSVVGFNGRTPLMTAAREGKQEVVEWMLHNFNAEREGMSLMEFINTKDKDGDTAIHLAALGGSVECVELLVQAGAQLSVVGFVGRTPLMTAALKGKLEVVEWMLHNFNAEREGMSLMEFINTKDKDGDTAIHLAAWGGSVECVKLLIQAGAQLSVVDFIGRTPLMAAAWKGKQEVVEWMLQNFNAEREGRSLLEFIKVKDKDSNTVINHAALGGSVECVELLVQAGAQLSVVGRAGRTPLMTAAREGKQEVVEWLLHNFNAEREGMSLMEFINTKDKHGNTVINHAALGGSVLCVELLVQAGAQLSVVGRAGRTPLMTAAREGKQEVVEWMLHNLDAEREGISLIEFINTKDKDGHTAILHAAQGGSVKCVELLVQAGAQLSVVGYVGRTPLMTAAREGKQEVVEWLLHNFNAEREGMSLMEFINTKDKDGITAIHLAARFGGSDIISNLLRQGGDVQCRTNHNSTPFHLAAEFQHPSVVRVLLEALDEADRVAALNSCDNDGDSVLMCGALGGSVECVELLVTAGAQLSVVNLAGETSLMAAAREGKQEVVEWLLHNFNFEREAMSLMEFIYMEDQNGNTVYSKAGPECRSLIDRFVDNLSAD